MLLHHFAACEKRFYLIEIILSWSYPFCECFKQCFKIAIYSFVQIADFCKGDLVESLGENSSIFYRFLISLQILW